MSSTNEPTPAEAAILARLERIGQGLKDPYAPFDPLPTQIEQFQATQQLMELRQNIANREIRTQDHNKALEQQAHEIALSNARLTQEADIRRAELELEYARLDVQKAEVVVRLLEASAKSPEMGEMVRALAGKLIAGPTGALQIEEKKP